MQTFEYPNLLTGTRSGSGWKRADGQVTANKQAYKWAPVLDLQNPTAVEDFLFSPPVTLHTGTDYVLSFLAACTGNVSSFDVHVLDVNAGYDGWVAAEMSGLARPGGGGSLVLPAVPYLEAVSRRSGVSHTLRQQRQHGRTEQHHLVLERHALRGHGASRVGACGGGGVAVSE